LIGTRPTWEAAIKYVQGYEAEFKLTIPKAPPGMPEAGLQRDIFGYQTPVFPAGKGEVTQISMDEYNRLVELRKEAGLVGPPPNVAIKPAVEGITEIEETVKVYHATIEKNLDAIREQGLKTPEGAMPSRWFMVTDSLQGAKKYATGENPIIIRYDIPKSEINKYLWSSVPSETTMS